MTNCSFMASTSKQTVATGHEVNTALPKSGQAGFNGRFDFQTESRDVGGTGDRLWDKGCLMGKEMVGGTGDGQRVDNVLFGDIHCQDLFAQCQNHIYVINANTDCHHTIHEEMKRQAKLDKAICQKMAAKAQRLSQYAQEVERLGAARWVGRALHELSVEVRQQAEASYVNVSALSRHCDVVQRSLEDHRQLMAATHGQNDSPTIDAAGISKQSEPPPIDIANVCGKNESLSIDTSLEESQAAGTEDPTKNEIPPWEGAGQDPKQEDIHPQDKTEDSDLSFLKASTMFEQIRKPRMSFVNKVDFLRSQYETTMTQVGQCEDAIASLCQDSPDGRQWSDHFKLQECKSRLEFLENRKHQMEQEVSSTIAELGHFDFEHQEQLSEVLNVFARHRSRYDTILRNSFQLLKAASLRETSYAQGAAWDWDKQEQPCMNTVDTRGHLGLAVGGASEVRTLPVSQQCHASGTCAYQQRQQQSAPASQSVSTTSFKSTNPFWAMMEESKKEISPPHYSTPVIVEESDNYLECFNETHNNAKGETKRSIHRKERPHALQTSWKDLLHESPELHLSEDEVDLGRMAIPKENIGRRHDYEVAKVYDYEDTGNSMLGHRSDFLVDAYMTLAKQGDRPPRIASKHLKQLGFTTTEMLAMGRLEHELEREREEEKVAQFIDKYVVRTRLKAQLGKNFNNCEPEKDEFLDMDSLELDRDYLEFEVIPNYTTPGPARNIKVCAVKPISSFKDRSKKEKNGPKHRAESEMGGQRIFTGSLAARESHVFCHSGQAYYNQHDKASSLRQGLDIDQHEMATQNDKRCTEKLAPEKYLKSRESISQLDCEISRQTPSGGGKSYLEMDDHTLHSGRKINEENVECHLRSYPIGESGEWNEDPDGLGSKGNREVCTEKGEEISPNLRCVTESNCAMDTSDAHRHYLEHDTQCDTSGHDTNYDTPRDESAHGKTLGIQDDHMGVVNDVKDLDSNHTRVPGPCHLKEYRSEHPFLLNHQVNHSSLHKELANYQREANTSRLQKQDEANFTSKILKNSKLLSSHKSCSSLEQRTKTKEVENIGGGEAKFNISTSMSHGPEHAAELFPVQIRVPQSVKRVRFDDVNYTSTKDLHTLNHSTLQTDAIADTVHCEDPSEKEASSTAAMTTTSAAIIAM